MNKFLTAVLVSILVIVFLTIVNSLINKNNPRRDNLLLSPVFQKITGQKVSPTDAPSTIVAPKTFKFDQSSDLKKELESINPQVLDSDFE